MEKKRFDNVDISKGILMLLVIINHGLAMTSWNENVLHCWNTTIAIPAFFILSGLMYNHEKWKRFGFWAFFIHRLQTIILPYLFYDITGGILVKLFLGSWSGLPFSGVLKGLLSIIKKTLMLSCNLAPNWFLPTLFLAELLLFLASCAAERKRNMLLMLYAAIAFVLVVLYLRLPIAPKALDAVTMRIARVLLAFVFLVVGLLCRPFLLRREYKLWQILLSFCLILPGVFLNGRPLMSGMHIPYVSVFLLCGSAGAYFVLAVTSLFHSKPLVYIGRNTLVLVGTHYIIRNLICLRPDYSFPVKWTVFLLYLLGVAAISAICIPLYAKLFPHVTGKKLIYDPRKSKEKA